MSKSKSGFKVQASNMPIYIDVSQDGYVLYMHLAHISVDNTKVQCIAQSNSMSEAAKIFTLSLMCLIQ